MNILICTIMRDVEHSIERYLKQLTDALAFCGPGYNWYLSIYENDSTDSTSHILLNLNYSYFKDYSLIIERLNTKKYGSIKVDDRVKNLANSRNKCLESKELYKKVDYILFIESDVVYTPDYLHNIINFKKYGLQNVDIFSGLTIIPETGQVYDIWATRRNHIEESGDRFEDWTIHPTREFWSTFNGVVLYNAEPFKKGIRFDWYNKRLNKFDCDTVVICELFREAGFNKIYVNQALICFHGV